MNCDLQCLFKSIRENGSCKEQHHLDGLHLHLFNFTPGYVKATNVVSLVSRQLYKLQGS